MRVKAVLMAAALLLALPLSATAASPSGCAHVISDPSGDAASVTIPALGEDDIAALDLVAVDLVTSTSTVVIQFEVTHLAVGTALDNRQWWAHFSGRSQEFQLVVSADSTGATAMLTARHPGPVLDAQLIDVQSTPVSLAFDTTTNTVRASGARSFFDSHGGLPSTIADFRASTSRAVGLAGPGEGHITSVGDTNDKAGPASYVTDATSSCVPA